MDVKCHTILIYYVHLNDDYIDNDIINNDSDGSDDIIEGIIINKIEVECKKRQYEKCTTKKV